MRVSRSKQSTEQPQRRTGALVGTLALLLGTVACTAPPADDGSTAAASDPRIVAFPVADDATVSFTLWFDVGSVDDPTGKEGLAALTGALISDGGSQNKTYEEILAALYPIASGYGVRVDKEMSTVSGRTHLDNLDAYVSLLTDAYLRPAFDESDFERLKSDQKNAIDKSLRFASEEELGKAALMEFVFTGTSYAHPVLGTINGLDAITIDDVRSFYQAHYTRTNVVLGMGGGYDQALLDRMRGTLDQLPEGAPQPSPAVTPAPIEGRHAVLVQKPDAYASISFGFPIDVSRGDRDYYALWIANSWLGEHRNSSSHLYQVIREARGLNYGDYSYIEKFPNGGGRQMPPSGVGRDNQIFEVWIRTLPNEQALFAIRAALHELEALITNGMSEEDFELTRSFLTKYHLHFAETTQTRLGYAVDDRFYGIEGEGHLEQFGRMMQELTRDDVNAAIKRHLQLDNLKLAIVTGEAEKLKAAIAGNEPAPIDYANPPSDEIQAEDASIARVEFGIAVENISIVPVETIFEGAE